MFEGEPGVIAHTDAVIIEGVSLDRAVDAAVRASDGADRIELCGGMPVDVAAEVREAVSDAIEVRLNRYGFESLEQVTAYKVAFLTGEPGDAAFFYAASETTPLTRHSGVLVAGVASLSDLAVRVREALARGAGIVELYAGLGMTAAATAREASARQLPVGFIDT